jgi:hypothetical protein
MIGCLVIAVYLPQVAETDTPQLMDVAGRVFVIKLGAGDFTDCFVHERHPI